MSTIQEQIQKPDPGTLITLFDIDATELGGTVYRFTPDCPGGQVLTFDGLAYMGGPINAEGFIWSGKGPPPTPKLRIANPKKILLAAVIALGDLHNAKVTRTRTFKRFLDGEVDADPTAKFTVDVFNIERKTAHNGGVIEWELRAAVDQSGVQLPSRTMLRDYCDFRYRHWVNGAWVVDEHYPCPYDGTSYFDINNQSVPDPSQDECNKQLSGCLRRPWPGGLYMFAGFPGLGRTRVP